ncbi:MAG: hypothetical protein LBL46_02920 [Rickettsiales bacterium]|jgi:hypothetical protein|nr:hypothetical protein [Rickettsiales bacterium]
MQILQFLKNPQFNQQYTIFIAKTDFFNRKLEEVFLDRLKCNDSEICRGSLIESAMYITLADYFKIFISDVEDKLAPSQLATILALQISQPVLLFIKSRNANDDIKRLYGEKPNILILEEDEPIEQNLSDFLDIYFPNALAAFREIIQIYFPLLGEDFFAINCSIDTISSFLKDDGATIESAYMNEWVKIRMPDEMAAAEIKKSLLLFLNMPDNTGILGVISCLDKLPDNVNLAKQFINAVYKIIANEAGKKRQILDHKKLSFLGLQMLEINPNMPNRDFILKVHQILLCMVESNLH